MLASLMGNFLYYLYDYTENRKIKNVVSPITFSKKTFLFPFHQFARQCKGGIRLNNVCFLSESVCEKILFTFPFHIRKSPEPQRRVAGFSYLLMKPYATQKKKSWAQLLGGLILCGIITYGRIKNIIIYFSM